jgi:PTS system nitrogen regulatory IIA component
MDEIKNDESLAALVKRGGVYRNIPGNNPREILSGIIEKLKNFNAQKKETLLQAVLEREALMSTGIENGIALPHPRVPVLEDGDKPFVALAFARNPPDWSTPDGSKVRAIFLIISKNSGQHLKVLTKINFLCQEEKFYNLISARTSADKIITAIDEAEKRWEAD